MATISLALACVACISLGRKLKVKDKDTCQNTVDSLQSLLLGVIFGNDFSGFRNVVPRLNGVRSGVAHARTLRRQEAPRAGCPTMRRMEDFTPQDLANIVWALAKVGQTAPRLFHAVADKASKRMDDFSPQDLGKTVWAFAKVQLQAPKLFDDVADRAVECMEDFSVQELTTAVWAFAEVDHPAPKLFDIVVKLAEERLEEFTPQELANTVWAFAKVDYPATKLFDLVAKRIEERLQDFKPQDLASSVWAFAQVRYPSPQLFNAVAERSLECMEDFDPPDLANIACAFAKVDPPASKLFSAVAERSMECIEFFKPQELGRTVWAFAEVGHPAPKFFNALAEERLEDLKPRAFLLEKFEKISDFKLLGAGHFSAAYSFNHDNKQLVLRVADKEHDFKIDQLISRKLHHLAVPIPKVLEIGSYGEKQFFCITTRCFGKTFDQLSHEDQVASIPSIFETLEGLHRLDISQTTGFGIIDLEFNGRHKSWAEALLCIRNHKVPYNYEAIYALPYFDKPYFDTLYDHLKRLVEILPEQRSFVHGDFGFDNIVLDSDKVTGVLDWAEARIGDPAYDVAWLDFWSDDISFAQHMIADSAQHKRYGQMFQERLLSCCLHIGVNSMLIAAHNNNEKDYHRVVKRIQRAFTRFG